MKVLYWIVWPAFLIATLATGLLITVIDPQQIAIAGNRLRLSNTSAYSLGFLILWLLAAASSLTTCILRLGSDDLNRPRCR